MELESQQSQVSTMGQYGLSLILVHCHLVIRCSPFRPLDGSDLEMSDDENGFGMQYSSEEEIVDTFENRDPESYQFSTLSIDEVDRSTTAVCLVPTCDWPLCSPHRSGPCWIEQRWN